MSFQPLPPAPPPPPPPPAAPRRRWVWPLVAVLALLAGAGAGVAVGMSIDDDESSPVAQETPAPEDTSGETGGENDEELEQLRERLEEVEQQRDDLKRRLDEARAELDSRETEPPEEESQESEPTPFEGEFTDGVFTFTDVQVLRDFAGDFEVRATVTNTGDETVDYVSWTAIVLYQGEPVSTLTTSATELAAGDSVDAQFIGFDDYGDWDAVEFSIDSDTDQT
ncbi:bZIP transcription factor [Jiangella aurantiaca]|uniref:BZIP transcription factor n=1 Tax=Jiangella aurantiaca TaxID=2530373 RepID=A0A4R5A6W3_9ACTN|nr:FxLYD domain-containing protein [Jiangella aurantiaca]TDD67833.1 bZIP transcription factor [Jiangella aurantiaca]